MHAYIPYGAYWSTPFARWQGSLSHLHSMKFAAHVAKGALADRRIDLGVFDFATYGITMHQHRSFNGTPWVTAMMGAERLTGPTISQVCATSARLVATAMGEMALGNAQVALLMSGDRTSNAAHIYYPEPGNPGGTGDSEALMFDNFMNDPFAKCAMVDTAENVAQRFGITTEEQHDLVAVRHEQYQAALADDRAFQKRFMDAEFAVPDSKFRKTVKTLQGDEGVYPTTREKMAGLKPMREGGTVTYAGQTHPADGNCGIVMVADEGRARELSPVSGGPTVRVIATGQGREEKAFMPAAPILAAKQALDRAGMTMDQVDVFKSHNPFAVNDIAFARAYGLDWRTMNNYGCSLIWGHPQGPTGMRAIIEMIEELEIRGGGVGLFQGCAAGDSGMAVLIDVR
ncbi:MAG: thiolase family protein [Rhodobacter sp.]|nr:thiolase family protein [Paracoccaceae bacterium]MCB1409899.1 thiolase family protein [Paracoccaceae bacterium]MCC0080652.1 thiolase family protein [Rhodobacter sp.]